VPQRREVPVKTLKLLVWGGLVAAVGLASSRPASAVDFIRGDANGDGKVSLADCHFLFNFLFRGGSAPECKAAADVDDKKSINVTDSVYLFNYLVLGGQEPLAPFPDPGPAELVLPCDSYGSGSPLEDPSARVEIAAAEVPGGNDRGASLTLMISNSVPLGGYCVRLRDPAGIIEDVSVVNEKTDETGDLTGTYYQGFIGSRMDPADPGGILIGFLCSFREHRSIGPGESVPALRISACIRPDTLAGEYPIDVEEAELVDFASARAVPAATQGGTVTVLADVGTLPCEPGVAVQKPNVRFALRDASGSRGAEVRVPLSIQSDRSSQGFTFSVDFDEEALQASAVGKLFQRPNGVPYDFETFAFDNENATPGNGGIDEGYFAGAAILSFADTARVLPVYEEVDVLELVCTVRESAPLGTTELKFMDGALGAQSPVDNSLIAGGMKITPDVAGSFVFVNGRVNIIPDGSPFVRGDSNADGEFNLSDPLVTLNWLFRSAPQPPCLDAADSNDDGTVNIADPILALRSMFLGSGPLPEPAGACGFDPTDADVLPCATFDPCPR
jgi:hypothetical protein